MNVGKEELVSGSWLALPFLLFFHDISCCFAESIGKYHWPIVEEGYEGRIEAFMRLPPEERNCNAIFNLGRSSSLLCYL